MPIAFNRAIFEVPKAICMKQVTLKVEDDKLSFFLELVENLGFVQLEDSKEEIVNNLKTGFEEMNLYKQGKLETTPLDEFLNEL